VANVHVSGAEDATRRGSRNQVWNWWRGFVLWIWEIVRGGFVVNWWARDGLESIWVSVVEVGVEVALRRSGVVGSSWSWNWGCGIVLAFRPGVGGMSPGATEALLACVHWSGLDWGRRRRGRRIIVKTGIHTDELLRTADITLRLVVHSCALTGIVHR
jgi:hypothetical protein